MNEYVTLKAMQKNYTKNNLLLTTDNLYLKTMGIIVSQNNDKKLLQVPLNTSIIIEQCVAHAAKGASQGKRL